MNARARPWWLLPCVLSACTAEAPTRHRGTSGFDAGFDGAALDDVDAGDPDRTYAPTFSAIYDEIFERRLCTSVFCHGIDGDSTNFSSRDTAYRTIVNVKAGFQPCNQQDLTVVVPFDPEASLLYLKVTQDRPPCGERMPKTPGIVLDPREIEQIREWITRGAPND